MAEKKITKMAKFKSCGLMADKSCSKCTDHITAACNIVRFFNKFGQ